MEGSGRHGVAKALPYRLLERSSKFRNSIVKNYLRAPMYSLGGWPIKGKRGENDCPSRERRVVKDHRGGVVNYRHQEHFRRWGAHGVLGRRKDKSKSSTLRNLQWDLTNNFQKSLVGRGGHDGRMGLRKG